MVRRLRYVVVCCSVLVALEARAQNGGLRGAVVDENNQPLAGAEVLLEPLGVLSRELRLESDANGTFVRVGIRLGQYRLTIQKEGYQTYSEEIKIRPGSPTRIDVILTSVAGTAGIEASEEEAAEYQQYF
ncbi:MAG: carboxypeptidase-like regulatory domain-containing protein, partial [Vicinamibacteria bacterium]